MANIRLYEVVAYSSLQALTLIQISLNKARGNREIIDCGEEMSHIITLSNGTYHPPCAYTAIFRGFKPYP